MTFENGVNKPLWKKWWFWVVLFLFFVYLAGSGGEDKVADVDEPPKPIEIVADEGFGNEKENVKDYSMGEEFIPKREDSLGKSDKDIKEITDLSTSRPKPVRNDNTGKWRVTTTSKSFNPEEYAISYFKTFFEKEDELHYIVNFNRNTTTSINKFLTILQVTIHERVDGEEHDANKLGGGMLYAEFHVHLDNGDIVKIN